MQEVESYPWGELAPGHYVYDANGVPWKLIEAHPSQPHTYLATNVEGDTAVLCQPPEKRVRALVADSNEVAVHLQKILGARALEGQMTVEGFPAESRLAFHKNALVSHIKMMHGGYTEPSMKYPELVQYHTYLHANAEYSFPHRHEEFTNG